MCDLAAAAGSCGHLTELRRLSIGSFTVEEAAPFDTVDASNLISPEDFIHRIDGLAVHRVTPEGALRIRDGHPVEPRFLELEPSGTGPCALLSGSDLLAIIEPSSPSAGGSRTRSAYRYRCVLTTQLMGYAS